MVTRFKDGAFVHPGALFRLTPEEQEAAAEARHGRSGAGWVNPVTGEDGEGGEDDSAEPETGDEDDAGFEREAACPASSACPGYSTGAGALYPEDIAMTHLSPDGGAVSPPPSTLSRQESARPSSAHPAL